VRAFFVAIYMLHVFKAADGRDRWVIVSSSAFRDRDREIVSTKALEADVARADADGDYGPLRWWHVKGLDIGDCDFNAMHGRLLVESGTFRHPAFAEMVKAHAGALGVSIGFLHPQDEPDATGIFHHIRRKERSLLPRGKESNLLTFVSVVKESTMTNEKVDTLKELVGDPAVVDGLLAGAGEVDKAAEAAGIAFKETGKETGKEAGEPVEAAPEDENEPAPEAAPEAAKMAEVPAEEDEDEDEGEEVAHEKPAKKTKRAEKNTVGAMSVDEFASRMGEALSVSLAAVVESTKATKAAVDAFTAKLEAMDTRLKELEGEQPAVVRQAHVASQEGDIAGALKEALKQTVKTQPNAIDGWVDFMMGAKK
jgi:hypothetical protein